ncbi:hypothetical protein PCYB_074280 [Plasmodium cynomolgi strain B]|uniref:Uncharacterized protein n=1 Tax=Plasmodium cynomolgi (strain B) TaxID=1120755 RepID=K6V9S1_PLACD|nr:hypothetical protein PCYB_074280 [Plasmodium cynomolgi strain B]GAB65927.1 hypothetical protein PCYB_074280 [Plasmodium cynomolgi strain B]
MDRRPPRKNTNPFIDSTEDSLSSENNPNVRPVNLNNYDFGMHQGVGATEGSGFNTNVGYNMDFNSSPNAFPNAAPNAVPNASPNAVPNAAPNAAPNAVPNYGFNYGSIFDAPCMENFRSQLGAMGCAQGNMAPCLTDNNSMLYFMQAVAFATAVFLNVVFLNRHMLKRNITKSEFEAALLGNLSREGSPSLEYQRAKERSYSPVHSEGSVDYSETYPLLGEDDYEPLSPVEDNIDLFEEDAGRFSPEGEYRPQEAEIQNLMNMSYENPPDRYLSNPFDDLSNQVAADSGAPRPTYQPPNYGEIYEGAQFADKYHMSNSNSYFFNDNGNNANRNANSQNNNYGYAHAPYADIFRHPNYANMYRATNHTNGTFLNGRNDNNVRNTTFNFSNNSASGVSARGASSYGATSYGASGEDNFAFGYDDSQFADSYQDNNYEITEEEEVDPFENLRMDDEFDFGRYATGGANTGGATTSTTGSSSQGYTLGAHGITNHGFQFDEGDNDFRNTERFETSSPPSSGNPFLTEPVRSTVVGDDTLGDDLSPKEDNFGEKENNEVSEKSVGMGHSYSKEEEDGMMSDDEEDRYSEYEKYLNQQSSRKEQKNYENRMRSYLHKYKKLSKGSKNLDLQNEVGLDVASPQEESPDEISPVEEEISTEEESPVKEKYPEKGKHNDDSSSIEPEEHHKKQPASFGSARKYVHDEGENSLDFEVDSDEVENFNETGELNYHVEEPSHPEGQLETIPLDDVVEGEAQEDGEATKQEGAEVMGANQDEVGVPASTEEVEAVNEEALENDAAVNGEEAETAANEEQIEAVENVAGENEATGEETPNGAVEESANTAAEETTNGTATEN